MAPSKHGPSASGRRRFLRLNAAAPARPLVHSFSSGVQDFSVPMRLPLCNRKLDLDPVDVVKENFSTSDSTAREPAPERVIAESSCPKESWFHSVLALAHYCQAELQFQKDSVMLPSLIKGNVSLAEALSGLTIKLKSPGMFGNSTLPSVICTKEGGRAI